MAKPNAAKSREARDHRATHFPFVSLPRELQDEICCLTLFQRMDFTLKDDRRGRPHYLLGVNNGNEDDKGFLESKPIIDTALLVVNKEISSVAHEVLSRLISSLDTLLSRSVVDGRIIESPSSEFLSLCQRSRFILDSSMTVAVAFLRSGPVNRFVRSLVLTRGMLISDDLNNRDAWSKKREVQARTPFTTLLQSHMPGLQEVALFVACTEGDIEYYCSHAPAEMCAMLEDGTLDVVRFLFRNEFEAEYDMLNCFFVNNAMRPPPKCVDGMTWEEHLELEKAMRDIPDRFAMKREQVERAPGWPDGKTVVAFRRRA